MFIIINVKTIKNQSRFNQKAQDKLDTLVVNGVKVAGTAASMGEVADQASVLTQFGRYGHCFQRREITIRCSTRRTRSAYYCEM